MFLVIRESLNERLGPRTETIARELQPHRIERAVRAAGGQMPPSWLLRLNANPQVGISIPAGLDTLRVVWRA